MYCRTGSPSKYSRLVKNMLISLSHNLAMSSFHKFFIYFPGAGLDTINSINSFAQKRESLYLAVGFSSSVSQGPWQATYSNLNFIFLPRVSGDFPPSFGDIPDTDSQLFMSGHTEAPKAVCEKSFTANSLMKPSLKILRDVRNQDAFQLKHYAHPIRFLRMMEMEIQNSIFLDRVKFCFKCVLLTPQAVLKIPERVKHGDGGVCV